MRIVCNICNKQLVCDLTTDGSDAANRQLETEHFLYHYIENLYEQYSAKKLYGTTQGIKKVKEIFR